MSELEKNLTNWAKVDKRISQLNNDIKILKDKREQIGEIVSVSLEEHDLFDKKFDFPDLERSITFSERVSQEGLTYKYLEECFNSFFEDTEKSKELMSLIKKNRKKSTKKFLKGDDV